MIFETSSQLPRSWSAKVALTMGCMLLCGCPEADLPSPPVSKPPIELSSPANRSPASPATDSQPDVTVPAPTAVGREETSMPLSPADAASSSQALTSFLVKFDRLSAKGFVPTLRSGSTGIGYTLETMLEIKENNSPGGDFMNMELKAFRDDDLVMDDAEKMNLFLKEPKWVDGLDGKGRVRAYGYVDDNGRPALYSTAKVKENSHGLALHVGEDRQRLWLRFKGQDVAYWTSEVLAKRLKEKHTEAVFVAAHAEGKGKDEQFHYYGVTWCNEPSVESFLSLIDQGDVMLEMRMHLKPTGSLRNHGSAFRIKQNRIRDLYRIVKQVRP